jgi:hypothetical protein
MICATVPVLSGANRFEYSARPVMMVGKQSGQPFVEPLGMGMIVHPGMRVGCSGVGRQERSVVLLAKGLVQGVLQLGPLLELQGAD